MEACEFRRHNTCIYVDKVEGNGDGKRKKGGNCEEEKWIWKAMKGKRISSDDGRYRRCSEILICDCRHDLFTTLPIVKLHAIKATFVPL